MNGSTARLESTGDITAYWCDAVWEAAEILLNCNSRDLSTSTPIHASRKRGRNVVFLTGDHLRVVL